MHFSRSLTQSEKCCMYASGVWRGSLVIMSCMQDGVTDTDFSPREYYLDPLVAQRDTIDVRPTTLPLPASGT